MTTANRELQLARRAEKRAIGALDKAINSLISMRPSRTPLLRLVVRAAVRFDRAERRVRESAAQPKPTGSEDE